jgi:hypothetical protein
MDEDAMAATKIRAMRWFLFFIASTKVIKFLQKN